MRDHTVESGDVGLGTEHDERAKVGQRGAGLVEYGLVAAILALALSFAVTQFTTIAQDDLTPRASLIGNPDSLTPTS